MSPLRDLATPHMSGGQFVGSGRMRSQTGCSWTLRSDAMSDISVRRLERGAIEVSD